MAQMATEHLEASKEAKEPKDELHELRKSIDAIIQWSGHLKGVHKEYAREMSLVYTKLQEAKMWTGKCLEMLGSELPKEYQDKA
jgi:hypothetical protein